MAVALDASRDGSPTTSPAPFRRLDIQGLRALAVIVVVLDHVGFSFFSGGFVGVDVFFVISGFVITTMLIRDTRSPWSSWFPDFYAKRARRIVPAATLIIVLTVIATFEFTNFLRGARVIPDATAASLFVANLHFIATGTDYARLGGDPSPLQHYWSLAVEEQFYLAWPLLMIAAVLITSRLRRINLRPLLFAVLGVIIIGSYLYSISITPLNGTLAFYSPLTRAWELALGCLLAACAPWLAGRVTGALAALLGWAGSAAIIWAVLALDAHSTFPGWIAAVPVFGAGALIAAGMSDRSSLPTKLLQLRAPRYIGDISYSLYLVHWPIFALTAALIGADFALGTQALLLGASLLGAVLMYHAFENPIRRSRFLLGSTWRSIALIPIAIAIVFAVVWFERYRWALSVPLVQQLF